MREIRLAHELAWVFETSDEPTTIEGWTVDWADPARRNAVEYDGARYHRLPGYQKRDERKTASLEAAGWTVVRLREPGLPPAGGITVPVPHSGRIENVVVATLRSLATADATIGLLPRVQEYLARPHARRAHAAAAVIKGLRERQSA